MRKNQQSALTTNRGSVTSPHRHHASAYCQHRINRIPGDEYYAQNHRHGRMASWFRTEYNHRLNATACLTVGAINHAQPFASYASCRLPLPLAAGYLEQNNRRSIDELHPSNWRRWRGGGARAAQALGMRGTMPAERRPRSVRGKVVMVKRRGMASSVWSYAACVGARWQWRGAAGCEKRTGQQVGGEDV